jgi:hypothetical protein
MFRTPRFQYRRRAGAVAATLCGMGLVAFGAASSPGVARLAGSTGTPSPTGDVATIVTNFARCARAHGATGLPDPTIDSQSQPDFRAMKIALGALPQAIQHEVAEACQLNLAALPPPPPPDAATLQALVHFAGCMRSHGLTDFPDPDPHQSGRFILPRDINPKSPSVRGGAGPYDTCRTLVPSGINIDYSSQGSSSSASS